MNFNEESSSMKSLPSSGKEKSQKKSTKSRCKELEKEIAVMAQNQRILEEKQKRYEEDLRIFEGVNIVQNAEIEMLKQTAREFIALKKEFNGLKNAASEKRKLRDKIYDSVFLQEEVRKKCAGNGAPLENVCITFIDQAYSLGDREGEKDGKIIVHLDEEIQKKKDAEFEAETFDSAKTKKTRKPTLNNSKDINLKRKVDWMD